MRRLLTHALAFILGIGVMFAVSWYQQVRWQKKVRKEWKSERALKWQDQGAGASESYYAEKFPVPLPRNLDFSSNTWQRLNYWRIFARSYQHLHYPKRHFSIETTMPLDPWEAAEQVDYGSDAARPWSLAMEAHQRIKRGEKFDDVVKWVAENYQYSTNKALLDRYISAVVSPSR